MAKRYLLEQGISLGLAHVYGFKTGVISGPEIPCNFGNNVGGAFVPTTQGLLHIGGCGKDLYELRGDSVQSLEWFKLDEKLSSDPGLFPAAYPLPTELEVTCTQQDNQNKRIQEM